MIEVEKTIRSISKRLKEKPDGIVSKVLANKWVSSKITNALVKKFAGTAPPRPRPFSLLSDYTSWESLTNKHYTGRHLPADQLDRDLPDLEGVAALWKRENGNEISSGNTSILFAHMAQWFTDSFLRTELTEREKNTSNHEIDYCQLYGLDASKAMILRLNGGKGKLASQVRDGEEYQPFLFVPERVSLSNWNWDDPESWPWSVPQYRELHCPEKLRKILKALPEERLKYVFATGLEHGNSSIGYMIFNTISLREHNRICDVLVLAHPDWGDERVFQTARNVMTVLLLNIVLSDYIGHITGLEVPFRIQVGMAERQAWYRNNWITLEFNILYRWHSMVPDYLHIGKDKLDFNQYHANTKLFLDTSIEKLVSSASEQFAGKIGLRNTHEFFFRPMGKDQAAKGETTSIHYQTVKMARDFKLQPMNAYRKVFGLKPITSFEQLTDDPTVLSELKNLYSKVDDIELMVGLYAERHQEGQMLGALMTRMVAHDAFTHIYTNPLLSKNIYSADTFSKEGLEIIENTSGFADFASLIEISCIKSMRKSLLIRLVLFRGGLQFHL